MMKVFFIYISLFLLFYFEPVEIGPLTFSKLWKIPLFLFLVWQVIILRNIKRLSFTKWSYARAGKYILNGGTFNHYFFEIADLIRYMMFPLMFDYVRLKVKEVRKLDKLLVGFSQFIIISGLPFITGLLKTKGETFLEIDSFESYMGIFQGAHTASISTAVAVLVLLSALRTGSPYIQFPRFNSLLVLFGIYLLYSTYVRTGYVMFVVGISILFWPKKISLKQIVSITAIMAIIIFGFNYLLETNEIFYNRIFDIRNDQETAIGSGRFLFWEAAFDLWINGDFFQLIFGHGFDNLSNKIAEVTGLKIYAHNEFFTQLGQNGLLGVSLFIIYILALFKYIRRNRSKPTYRLALSVLALYFSLMMTQGGMWFQLDIFMVFVFVKLYLEQEENCFISRNEALLGESSRVTF